MYELWIQGVIRISHTNIVRVELINSNHGSDGRCAQRPFSDLAENGEFARMQVVDERRIKLGRMIRINFSS